MSQLKITGFHTTPVAQALWEVAEDAARKGHYQCVRDIINELAVGDQALRGALLFELTQMRRIYGD